MFFIKKLRTRILINIEMPVEKIPTILKTSKSDVFGNK